MTLFFANHQITIYRNRKIGSSNRFSMSATLTAYSIDIQPASDQRTQYTNGRFGATFVAYVDSGVEVKEQDKIVTEDGKNYRVTGVGNWSGAGLLDHKELMLTSLDG